MESKALKAEGILRVVTMLLAALAALMISLDSQTKPILFVEKKASTKDLDAVWSLIVVSSVTAGYQLLQLCRCFAFAWFGKYPCGSCRFMSWVCFLLDQGATYVIFTATMAATQAAAVAVFGVPALQWEKLCNIYVRFCEVAFGGFVCSFLASLAMIVISSISARHLFRLYPSPELRRRPPLMGSVTLIFQELDL